MYILNKKNGHNLIIHLLMYVQYAGTHEISLPFYYFFLERFLLLILTNKKFKDVFFSLFTFSFSKEIGDVLQIPPDPGAEYKPRLKQGNLTDEFL